jgi:Leucine Rich repeats (2 copies)
MSSAYKMPRRPRFRISVRVMMLIVLVIAVLLGWQANKAREQREAVAAVQRYGGWVHYDYEFVNGTLTPGQRPWAPRWLRAMLGDEVFQNVKYVSLVYDGSPGKRFDNSNVQACDDLLKKISKLPGLKQLLLKETQTTDDGLMYIGKMTELEDLWIWDAKSVTDAGVAHLAHLKNLKTVHMNNSNLTNDSLVFLSRLPRIEELSLEQNHFSDEGLARLHGKDGLKRLYIGLGDGQITNTGLAHLRDFRKLEILDLQNSKVTDQGLEQLTGLPNLKELWLSGTRISATEVQRLQDAIPSLKITGLR